MSSVQHSFPQFVSSHVVLCVLHHALKVSLETPHVLRYQSPVDHQLRRNRPLVRVQPELHPALPHAQVELRFRTLLCQFVGARQNVILAREGSEDDATGVMIACESRELVPEVHEEEVEGKNETVRVGVLTHCHHVDRVALVCVLQEFRELRGGCGTEALWRHVDVETDATG